VHYDQAEYDLRCEWGLAGVQALAQISDVLIVVDVLVFSTAVDIAVARGASVLPYRWRDSSAEAFAKSKGALLASPRAGGYSLSPPSLLSIPAGTALVLPSPNGSTLCTHPGTAATFTACLRNCRAVAAHARARGSRIAVVPAGEQWGDGALRPAIEDLIGAGAVLASLPGRPSPEAETAIAAFERFRHNLHDALARRYVGQRAGGAGICVRCRGSRRIRGEHDGASDAGRSLRKQRRCARRAAHCP
jgi:2-phosphosulfolactate phosphatase